MNKSNVLRYRLRNQRLMNNKFSTPLEVVKWFGAVQAQDYKPSLWGIGLRFKQSSMKKIEMAIEEKHILRTWPMRNTIHFVPAKDAAWMLKLLTPRASARAANVYRKAGLDESIFLKSIDIVIKALQGGKYLTRKELYRALEVAGIQTSNARGVHIIGQLAYRGLICFGPRSGKQPTFVLLDEWVTDSVQLEGAQALAEITRRYFNSHGPATIQDFAWWSGLSLGEAKRGLQYIQNELRSETIDGMTHWFAPITTDIDGEDNVVHVLPMYDEFTVAYKHRSLFLPIKNQKDTNNGISRVIVRNGHIVGKWDQVQKKDQIKVFLSLFVDLDSRLKKDINQAIEQYGGFLSLPIEIVYR
ncbi:winged helix DNA-binding domain-containing protein [Shimazuella kribbensis]|uniref:winged helix DNA-binding domain-containing protein n=1 Tax=Shimazuella kribbensis TaxID=139808 RepID=UPI000415A818|nr:winged helix DNA-binding domain-containing protein [Shimazuella kribbensis]